MKIHIVAIGRLKAGPESELFARYAKRFENMGRARGFSGIYVREFAESPGKNAAERQRKEAEKLLRALPERAVVVALDETGSSFASDKFAGALGRWADQGVGDLAFVLGGPDGLDRQVLDRAGLVLCLGAMTWPHQIARILLSEQLYRAASILSGHPYHRS